MENVQIVRLLAQLNVDPFVRDRNFDLTALDYAVGKGLSLITFVARHVEYTDPRTPYKAQDCQSKSQSVFWRTILRTTSKDWCNQVIKTVKLAYSRPPNQLASTQ